MLAKSAPQFQRPEGRADFERARNAARQLLADSSPEEALNAITRLDHQMKMVVLNGVMHHADPAANGALDLRRDPARE